MPDAPRYEPERLHQLKNQLAIVVGFADLLLQECAADDPRRPDLQEVQKAARAAMALLPSVVANPGGN